MRMRILTFGLIVNLSAAGTAGAHHTQLHFNLNPAAMETIEGTVSEFLSAASQSTNTGTVFEIGSPDMDLLRAALAQREDVTLLGPGNAGRLQIRFTGDSPSALNRELVLADIPIDAFSPQQRSLEDVFMEVTT